MLAFVLAMSAVQAIGTPGKSIAPSAVRQEITLLDCVPAGPAKCAREAVVVRNGTEGICTDAVMPSGLYKVGLVSRHGYLTRAELAADNPAQGSAATEAGSDQVTSTELLVTMNGPEPSRLCVPRHVILDGRRLRLQGDAERRRRAIAAAILGRSGLGGVYAIKGFRIARARSVVEAYPLGESTTSVADLAAVRMLGEYLFGTGASALIAVKIVSDKPKPVLLDGTVRGRTNISFQVARAALDRLVVRDGTSLKPIQKCQLVAGEQQQYVC